MWNFMWLDIDSSLQTNDSKWLDSFCDSTLTRPNHDSDSDSKKFQMADSKGLWLWLDKNDSGTSLTLGSLSLLSIRVGSLVTNHMTGWSPPKT